MSTPFICALGAMLCWGIGDFLIQKTVKKIGALEALFWISFFSSFFLLPWAWRDLMIMDGQQAILLIVLGLVGFTSGAVHLKAMRVGKLAVVEAILSLELGVSALWGIIFFRERLSPEQFILLILILAGIIMLSVDFRSVHKSDWLEKGSLLALSSALIVGTINFLTAYAAKAISPVMSLYLPWLVIGLVCLFLIKQKKGLKPFWQKSRPHWVLILNMVIIDLLAWLFFALAVSREELAITVAITESYVVIAMILGVIVNKEKLRLWQYLGAGLAVSSSIVIGLISK